ncbi:MAG: hypothetical protein Q9226_002256 [Calogaya cf. arnoldii]
MPDAPTTEPSRGEVNQARSFSAAVKQQYLYLVESTICRAVDNPHFIRAFEGGRNDCGMFLEDQELTGTLTERFFRAVSSNAPIILMEIKTVSPVADNRGNISWKIEFSKEQLKSYQVVLVASTAAPDFVALIPMHLIKQRKDLKEGKAIYETYRPLWSIHPPPLFPPEFSPFLVPLKQLGRALECIRETNEFTGVPYTDVPPPAPGLVKDLVPYFEPWVKAMAEVEMLHQAFKEKASAQFDVEMLDIFPLFRDFKFVSRADPNVEVIGEMKDKKYYFNLGQNPYIRHMQHAVLFGGRKIFGWRTQWDILFTFNADNNNQALLLPRDLIPHYWWNKDTPNDGYLHWPSNTKSFATLRQYVVNLKPESRLIADVERILQIIQHQRGSMKANNPTPMQAYQFERLDDMINEGGKPTRVVVENDDIRAPGPI